MSICILDGFTANPGDLDWEVIRSLDACSIYDRTGTSEEVLARAFDAEIVLTNKTVLSADTIHKLPKLKMIGVLATGVNVVDLEAAKVRNIPVCNVPAYSTPGVAQAVFALLLELTNRTGLHNETVHAGRWSACEDFCYWEGNLVELAGQTLGIIGYGRIGAAVCRIGQAFGMHVLAYRRNSQRVIEDGVQYAHCEQVFRESDVVSLHCPLTKETEHMVNASCLSWMKPTAYLINTARGGLINEDDLASALNANQLAGAGIDVLSTEPPSPSNPLLTAQNCIITPHIAWATRSARERLLQITAENIAAFLAGSPQNVV